jgi:beta-lactamase class A
VAAATSPPNTLPPRIATAAAELVTTAVVASQVPATLVALAATPTPEANRAQEQAVAAVFGQLPPVAAAVYRNLSGPERAELDAAVQVPAASTIKLPIMIEVFRQVEAGRLTLSQAHTVTRNQVVGGTGILQNQVGRTLSTLELVETSLIYSDNVGGNMLTNLVGMESVNATMRELGFTQTRLARQFMDLEAQRRGLDNLTSAGDMAEMLSRIHRGQLVSPAASAEMQRILRLRGERREPGLDFLGRHLSPRPNLAHLNGTLAGVRNEAGIIEANGRAFVLTILLRGQTNEPGAEEAIARAAASIQSIVSESPTR